MLLENYYIYINKYKESNKFFKYEPSHIKKKLLMCNLSIMWFIK